MFCTPQHYPSAKVIVPVAKIRNYLLKPGSKHYHEFIDVGYTPSKHVRLFKDIETEFDIDKASEYRQLPTGIQGFSVYMMLGVTKQRQFITCWKIVPYDNRPQFVTAYRIGKRGDTHV